MSSKSAPFFDQIKSRRTHYHLTNESTIPDTQLEEIVKQALTHVPSSFNVQSARALILFGDNHRTLWQKAAVHAKKVIPEAAWPNFEGKIKGLENAHGTVLFFEDQDALDTLGQKNPSVQSELPAWSANSAGMHHFAVWTAISLEGLGGNLQHYNMMPGFSEDAAQTWNIPESWKLNAQLVFGTPAAGPGQRTYLPIEPRVRVVA